MKKHLEFQWGLEKQIKVSVAGKPQSLFYEAYRQALAGVVEIVRTGALCLDGTDPLFSRGAAPSENLYEYGSSSDQYYYNYPSNMIVFTGERGAGKSSVMLTFVDSLKKSNALLFQKDFIDDMVEHELPFSNSDQVLRLLQDCAFLSLPPIDPTVLENDGQILTMILSRMYQVAASRWETIADSFGGTDYQALLNKKNDLLDRFSKCHNLILSIKKQPSGSGEYNGLDELADMGDSTLLKRELAMLVKRLLEFCGSGRPNSFLILQIDDTDMNIRHAYNILEDIRKYLVIPGVIIVMAANLEHLLRVVESNLLSSYEGTVAHRDELARGIANQYITKLFPQTRQISLPPLSVYLKEHVDTTSIQYDTPQGRLLPDSSSEFDDLQDQIFRLIYRKTGMIFLRHRDQLHYIIPDNMRLLSHFLSMFCQMKDVADPDNAAAGFFLLKKNPSTQELQAHLERLQARLQNVQRFWDYFLSTWAENHLTAEDVLSLTQLSKVNLKDKLGFISRMAPQPESGTHQPSSYAELMRTLMKKEEETDDERCRQFLFALHCALSFMGHCVVLEDLIAYYEKKLHHDEGPIGCRFLRLYRLFGSQLFPHCLSDCESRPLYQNILVNQGDREEKISLNVRWQTNIFTGQQGGESIFPLALNYLLSFYVLFLDYNLTESAATATADLCSLIVNCLYINLNETSSRFVRKRWSGETPFANLKKDVNWEKVQENMLLVVLNWDVQSRIGRSTASGTSAAYKLPTGTIEQFLGAINTYYHQLAVSLRPSQGTLPFLCLEKLDLEEIILFMHNKFGSSDPESSDHTQAIMEFFALKSPASDGGSKKKTAH